jgi:FtsP/CotA-like multicopper oxidase with cupredoxin domain
MSVKFATALLGLVPALMGAEALAPAEAASLSFDRVSPAAQPDLTSFAELDDGVAAWGPEATLPHAEPNDHRKAAGRMVDGELHVELVAKRALWQPRGPDGPTLEVHAWAEKGGPPQVPGPLIRVQAGTPVRVTLENTLERDLQVRGLVDRATTTPDRPDGVPAAAPDLLFVAPVVVPAGERREVRFTPTTDVTTFYTARSAPPYWLPFGHADGIPESTLLGGLIVDAADRPAHDDERLIIISQLPVDGEGIGLKLFFNGLSWPFTERLRYAVGDTVRWRVLNLTLATHPMHLHGFYYRVDGVGNSDADTVYAPDERRMVVTEELAPVASMRMTWVPEEPGNWLFHCHIIRHMGPLQRFPGEGELPDPAHDHEMHHMAGIVLGITIDPPPGWDGADPAPARRIDLWTGSRPGVFGDKPELGFVAQEGADPPGADSIRVPGSPIVLTRGEPAEIVVHNRLDVPIAVHWHGLELRSLYDGVGHWSGMPGAVRPPIPPSDSASVIIEPRRAGTFMYHIHGETGHELTQGLYGAFLVLEPGEAWDPDRDRVYVLGARGAELDSPPVVNGHAEPPAERFEAGQAYRLRFLHISPDETKVVRLLRDGEPLRWRARAKDGADLPAHQQVDSPAEVRLAVGETYDFVWTPAEAGDYVLEVRTNFYEGRDLPPVYQRVPFRVHSGDRIRVTSADQLPARTYPLSMPPSALLDDHDAFLDFAARVEADLRDDLATYEIEDAATEREFVRTLSRIALLAGRHDEAAALLDRVRALEDRPAARLTTGLLDAALIEARRAPADGFGEAFRARLDEAVGQLPMHEVEARLRTTRRQAATASDGLLRGRVGARMDPAAAGGEISAELARSLIGLRAALELVPVVDIAIDVLDRHLAAHETERTDIWAERDVTLEEDDVVAPVVVAIWDSGVDVELFEGRLFVDADPPPGQPIHGIAFDLEAERSPDLLYVPEARQDQLARCPFKGFSDIQAGLDSPEADALRARLAAIQPAEVRDFLEFLNDCQAYVHGTHVAGIATRGNPGIRILGARFEYGTSVPPPLPTLERIERYVVMFRATVDYFKRSGVRVANMSWGLTPGGIERALEMNGAGAPAEERRAMARGLYDRVQEGLTAAIASAPEILFVAAAGNADSDNRFHEAIPAAIDLPNVITVGAVDVAGDEAAFTSYGKVEVYANGVEVESVLPGGAIERASGTSMAAPQVANLAAKLLALDPELDTATLRALILEGAEPRVVGEGRRIRLLHPARSMALLRAGAGASRGSGPTAPET